MPNDPSPPVAGPPGSAELPTSPEDVTAAVQLTLLLQRFLTPYQEDFEWAHQKWPDMKGAMHDVVIGYARMNVAGVVHQHFAAQHAASVAATEARLAETAPKAVAKLLVDLTDAAMIYASCECEEASPDKLCSHHQEIERIEKAPLAAFAAVAQQRAALEQERNHLDAVLNDERVKVAALQRRVEELEGRLAETYVDDLGNAWVVPTPWAYAAACKALDKHRSARQLAEIELKEAKEDADRFRQLALDLGVVAEAGFDKKRRHFELNMRIDDELVRLAKDDAVEAVLHDAAEEFRVKIKESASAALQRRVEELEGKVKDLEFDVLFGEGPDAPR